MDDFNWLLDDYNTGGGGGGGGGGYDFNYTPDYDLSSGYNGGNFGEITYNPGPSTSGGYDLGYDPSYQFEGVKYGADNNWGGDFGTVSTGTTTNTPWWEPSPSPSYQQPFAGAPAAGGFTSSQPFTYTATSGDGNFGFSNTGSGQSTSFGGPGAGSASLGAGTFAGPTNMAGGAGTAAFEATTTSGNQGITGGFGVNPNTWAQDDAADRGSVLENTVNRAGNQAAAGAGYVKDKVGGALKAVDEYSATKPGNARLMLEGAGMLIGAYNQRNANKEAGRVAELQAKDREALRALQAEQMQMQRDAYERNMQQLDRSNQQVERNNQTADQFNAQATQSVNEARSLYNPQEMALRGMAQQRMGTQNLISENEREMRRRGMSSAAIAAESRRARLGGTTGETTAYFRGLDTGRVAQQGALSSAKNLAQQYGQYGTFSGAPGLTTSLGATPDFTGAERMSKAGADMTKQYKDMLNLYLDDPIYRSEQERQQRVQKKAAT